MARLKPLPINELDSCREIFENAGRQIDKTANSLRTLARKPEILRSILQLSDAIMVDGEVPKGLKFLAGYLASMSAGCQYCSAHTSHRAFEIAGLPVEKIEAVWEYSTSPLYSEAERAALDFARLAGQVPNGVTDSDYAALEEFFTEGQIVEILSAISLYGFWNRWNDSLATELESNAYSFADEHITDHGWNRGRHGK